MKEEERESNDKEKRERIIIERDKKRYYCIEAKKLTEKEREETEEGG